MKNSRYARTVEALSNSGLFETAETRPAAMSRKIIDMGVVGTQLADLESTLVVETRLEARLLTSRVMESRVVKFSPVGTVGTRLMEMLMVET